MPPATARPQACTGGLAFFLLLTGFGAGCSGLLAQANKLEEEEERQRRRQGVRHTLLRLMDSHAMLACCFRRFLLAASNFAADRREWPADAPHTDSDALYVAGCRQCDAALLGGTVVMVLARWCCGRSPRVSCTVAATARLLQLLRRRLFLPLLGAGAALLACCRMVPLLWMPPLSCNQSRRRGLQRPRSSK